MSLIDQLAATLSAARPSRPLGRVAEVRPKHVMVSGLSRLASVGDVVRFAEPGAPGTGRVIGIDRDLTMIEVRGISCLSLGDHVILEGAERLYPSDDMIGRIIGSDGRSLDGRPLLPGREAIGLHADLSAQADATKAKPLLTGIPMVDLLNPIKSGWRVSVDAEQGVGIFPFVSKIATEGDFDLVVWARSAEIDVSDLSRRLGETAMKKVICILEDDLARAALAAGAIARFFKRSGKRIALFHGPGVRARRDAEPSMTSIKPGQDCVSFIFVNTGTDIPEDRSLCDARIRMTLMAAEVGLMPPVHPSRGSAPADLPSGIDEILSASIETRSDCEILNYFVRREGAWSATPDESKEWLAEALVRRGEGPSIEEEKGQPNP